MSEMLAILGGPPVTTKEWPSFNTIGDEEKAEVLDVLNSGILSDYHGSPGDRFLGGKKVRRFEEEWAAHFGVRHAVAANSASSSLHSALIACGVGRGDEVIVPQLGMSAVAAVVLAVAATPVFADCDGDSMLLDPDSAASLVTSATKAIMPVHLAGHPAPMDAIMDIARRHGLFVIEDNAQGPGTKYRGRWAGTVGHIGCFSLNCHKVIQCGEGGVSCTNDDALGLRLQLARNHGEKCSRAFGLRDRALYGLNLRMTELQAAVAIHQLRKLDWLIAHTQRLARYLTATLRLPGLHPPAPAPDCTHAYYVYHWDYRTDEMGMPASLFAKAVQAEGVPVYAHYGYLMSRLPPFADGDAPDELTPSDPRYPGACRAIRDSLWTMLLRWPLMENDIDVVIAAITKVYLARHRLLR